MLLTMFFSFIQCYKKHKWVQYCHALLAELFVLVLSIVLEKQIYLFLHAIVNFVQLIQFLKLLLKMKNIVMEWVIIVVLKSGQKNFSILKYLDLNYKYILLKKYEITLIAHVTFRQN